MKGIVFTELLAMAEGVIGEAAVDELLDGLALASGGAYSAVGQYPCEELFEIVGALSGRTGMSGEALQEAFGGWMLGRFLELYPGFFAGKRSALDMLDAIEGEVHREVRKLYPEAELPTFETEWFGARHLRMRYRSARPLAAFCLGLVKACVAHFGDPAEVAVVRAGAREAVFDVRLGG